MDKITKFFKRFTQPSSWTGLSLAVLGVGELAKANEASALAEVVANVGPVVASQGIWPGLTLLLGGIAGVYLNEKGSK